MQLFKLMFFTFLSVEIGEESLLSDVDEVLHSVLESPPLELNRHQLVCRHHRLHGFLKILIQSAVGFSATTQMLRSDRWRTLIKCSL